MRFESIKNIAGNFPFFFKKQDSLAEKKDSAEARKRILRISSLKTSEVFEILNSSLEGLNQEEIEHRSSEYGKNIIASEKPLAWYWMILNNFRNPFILVLVLLGIVSYATDDVKGALIVAIMVVVSVLMRFTQEFRSTNAAEALRVMVRTKATVKRVVEREVEEPVKDPEKDPEKEHEHEEGKGLKKEIGREDGEKGEEEDEGEKGEKGGETESSKKSVEFKSEKIEVPIEDLVPGDIVFLSAGDMIPADVRLIRSKDIFISQSALTGESMPVEKHDIELAPDELENINGSDMNGNDMNGSERKDKIAAETKVKEVSKIKTNSNPLERNNLCFMGTSVVSGFGEAIVVATGRDTILGSLAKNIIGYRPPTSFDIGINRVTWILIRVIAIMVPIIFLINGLDKGNWKDAFLFAIAVAVGLTPEMLPMIVTANLAKGAVAMSKFKVIVKRLNSIQSLGAMNILCTDKTGTLTQDKIILERYLDINGEDSTDVLEYGFLNSYYQSGLKNMLDRAILDHWQLKRELHLEKDFKKIDEIPFDFVRKRLSVVIRHESEENLLICKGSVDEVLKICQEVKIGDTVLEKTEQHSKTIHELADELGEDGFRVIAVAFKRLPLSDELYSVKDEKELIFVGLMAFLDPPKETANEAIKILKRHGVRVKILTGDNEIVTKRVCKEVKLPFKYILLGSEIEEMSDKELSAKVLRTTIFAKLTPLQKARIIKILKAKGNTVGFLGDGINDAAGLRDADVGISVDTATDIARESADIILLEKSLLVLGEGVIKGREVYGNIIKYIKMTVSSNFGNVFSVLIASAVLPFLPMMPIQILVQNLLYDFSQLAIPWDRMDNEFLKKSRTWDPSGLVMFMVFIEPISSIFDMTTFWLMWNVFGANSVEHQALFQSGWFVEGLLSQTLIVHMIRTTKIPFIQSMATTPLIMTTVIIMIIGIYIPFSTLGRDIGLVPLPDEYFLWLLLTLIAYSVLTQLVKMWYIRKFKRWL